MRWTGEAGAGTKRRASRESRRRATTTRPVRAASRAIERSQSLVVEMSKPRDRRNPAQPSAKHDSPKASTWSPSWSLSWYRSWYPSGSSERTPESRRRGWGRDVEKRRDTRSLTVTRETPGRLIQQAEPQTEPHPEPQAELQPEVSRNSILALGRRTRWPGRHSEWCSESARRLCCRREHLCFLPPLRQRIHKWTSFESKRFHASTGGLKLLGRCVVLRSDPKQPRLNRIIGRKWPAARAHGDEPAQLGVIAKTQSPDTVDRSGACNRVLVRNHQHAMLVDVNLNAVAKKVGSINNDLVWWFEPYAYEQVTRSRPDDECATLKLYIPRRDRVDELVVNDLYEKFVSRVY